MLSTKPQPPLALLGDVSVDEAIMKCIVGDWDRVQSTYIGDSGWSWPLRVSLVKDDSTTRRYFIAKGDLGMSMLRGEYESMSLLYSIIPDNVVKPLAWGICSSQPDHSFYISSFYDLINEQPDMQQFCTMVARFHEGSSELFEQAKIHPKPQGRFGFHLTTHMGAFPQDNDWCDSWEEIFARGMRKILDYENDAQGSSMELASLAVNLLEKVIPRLLRPMETHVRSLRSSLVHGDLQIRNVKKDKGTQKPLIFDAGSFWGHNESHYSGNTEPRELALDDMRYLVEKYPCGYDYIAASDSPTS
ncbi:uncharacterized protein E0L32_005979 [Thyridium curvatum]|uniref:protein-ribulosamine 3-kinase n=1 Tax=Thyridium curvatum TaxID=1093900 RepID=A0A507B9P9_9PEZI|nr:uncharacterized protein E0L32_005979 [Thyridium curvatum]TPX13508.1 hypothetical protein E0L32_005979 [Thyridium curvatum]